MQRSRALAVVCALGAVTATLGVMGPLATSAAAAASRVALTDLSGGQPAGSGCATDAELSPQVAINPTDPHNIVVAWDQMTDGGSDIVAAASLDGGHTWLTAVVPGMALNPCPATGGNGGGLVAGDASLSFGPDGTVYLAAMLFVWGNPVAANTEAVAVSHDRGLPGTWSAPVSLGAGDRGVIAADPTVPGAAYVAELAGAADQEASVAVQRTTDGGTTWSTPVIAVPTDGSSAIAPVIAVTGHGPTGTRLMVAYHGGIDPDLCCTFVQVVRSDDSGATWSKPTVLAETSALFAADPDGCGEGSVCHPLCASDCQPIWNGSDSGPAIAASGTDNGDAYLVWPNHNSERTSHPDSGQVMFSRLTTIGVADGVGFSTPKVVNKGTAAQSQMFEPRIAVAGSTIGVTYYDDRNDAPGDDYWSVDLWLATSTDRGESWRETHIAGPFDVRPAEGSFTAYNGLTSAGKGFAAAFVSGPGIGEATGATEGSTDVMLAVTR